MVLFFITITVSFVSSTVFAVQGVADRERLTSPFKGWRTERVLQGDDVRQQTGSSNDERTSLRTSTRGDRRGGERDGGEEGIG
jgi:hypothetical protein